MDLLLVGQWMYWLFITFLVGFCGSYAICGAVKQYVRATRVGNARYQSIAILAMTAALIVMLLVAIPLHREAVKLLILSGVLS